MEIEVSNGEIVDKVTILIIKSERISDQEKLVNVNKELETLKKHLPNIIEESNPLFQDLLDINKELWDIEDRIRDKERDGEFDEEFISLARSVYFTNDRRSEVKKEINLQTGSNLIEEKSYKSYQ